MKYLPLLLLLISCQPRGQKLKFSKLNSGGDFMQGEYFIDSLIHGKVSYFDKDSNYIGHSVYKYGIEVGPTVRIKNGLLEDSIEYDRIAKCGYEYLFDPNGRLYYKAYLYDGRVVGPVYLYSKTREVEHYYYYNFEGNVIYEVKYDSLGRYEKGNPINMSINTKNINDRDNNVLFLYLTNPENEKSYYELAILNSKKKILSTKRIYSNNIYSEIFLNTISDDKRYAIIFHRFDSKSNESVAIREIEL